MLNPAARVRIVRVGRSGEPVVVADGALLAPERAVDAAAALHFTDADDGRGGYPGIRAKAPRPFVDAIVAGAAPLVERVFGLRETSLVRVEGSFSLVTAAPETLHPMQRLPHIDTRDPRRVAILCYLGQGETGGTAFFRQDATGLEQVGPEAFEAFQAARRADLARLAPGGGYPTAQTPGYTETAHFEARFNRLLVYRSCSLHSGAIPSASPLSADPRRGRLTANFFLDYAPA